MRKTDNFLKAIIVACVLFIGVSPAMAQCSFTPSVTPNNMMLCPNETDTIWTQVYDSYQWYKEGVALPGEDKQFLVVEQYQDAGSMFSVEVTLNSCTETSAEVMVDGHVFMIPYIMSWSNGWTSNMGEQEICKGDTLFMELGPSVYDSDIKWFKNGIHIPNVTGHLFKAVDDGDYSVMASTSICPNYYATPGVELPLIVHDIQVPEIDALNDTLFVVQLGGGLDYQWYFEGNILPGETNIYHIPANEGEYAVKASINSGECEQESEPFLFQFSFVPENKISQNLNIYPNPVSDVINIRTSENNGQIIIFDFTGNVVKQYPLGNGTSKFTVSDLKPGIYFLQLVSDGQNLGKNKFVKN